ncbi:GGDEF domain-containing protein [Lachnospira pectinoschiza]|uniref:Diguanylate cyclase (GGDEF) domain-containing protein n=1 Tax=Lachnospira pectinoschiza TaxID=28052 RepID=A0A1G9Y7D5_9FIRM|nr:diguanylate cyclase [Lachnospira pectinoschiza]SDN04920.1 diguanylate cyclase (GGDEF) domain-containing protein [Lachnospira pectinoschiza]
MRDRKNSISKKNIELTNMKRAIKSSFVLAVILPFLMLAYGLTSWNDNGLKIAFMIGAVILEIIQISYCVVLYIQVRNDEFETFKILYMSYYVITVIMLMLASGSDMKVFDSEILYIIACAYFIFVPIVNEKDRLIIIIAMSVIMVTMVLIFRMDVRYVIDVCLIQILTMFVSRYQHNINLRHEKMNNSLRKKTDYSEHDPLTGLFNRRGLESRANAIWPYCERNKVSVGILALDIDYFKKYNDAYGHPQGDECLKQVARVLRESAQRSTDVVTRTGGEEFIIFVQDTDEHNIVQLALKIRRNLEAAKIPHAYKAISNYVTVSIGAATFVPGYGKDFDKLYENADKALYAAKNNGRNCIVYEGNLYGRIKNGIAQVISM